MEDDDETATEEICETSKPLKCELDGQKGALANLLVSVRRYWTTGEHDAQGRKQKKQKKRKKKKKKKKKNEIFIYI